MQRLGVRFVQGVAWSKDERRGEGIAAVLADGRELASEQLLFAAGRTGRTEGLGLEMMGLAADKRGCLAVDAHYRTQPDRNRRALLGKSSGGYGSVVLAMRHPEVFGLMACHSGDMYFEYCYKPDLIGYVRSIKRYGGLDSFLARMRTMRPRDVSRARMDLTAL